MPWIIWAFWVHKYFFHAHWDDSILFCPQIWGGRGGGEEAWVVLFCLLHWACKVVSELTGWNWELLWSLLSISQSLKSKEREGTRAFHGFSANINKVTFLGSSRRERSVLTKNDLLSEFFLRSKHEIEANGCFAWLQTYFCTRLAEGSAARGSRLTKLELVKWGFWLKSDELPGP